MKKMNFTIAAFVALTVGLSSCIEHEVIPAPVPMVDLSCHFQGTINGTDVELTENVLGYKCTTSKAKILLPPPSLSSAVYYSEILSAQTPISVKVGLGSVMWDMSTANDPTLALFNGFHLLNTTPVFSNGAAAGFEVTYKDLSGTSWVSKQNSTNFQDVTFSAITQESDTAGDYSKFTCNFDCYVYHTNPTTLVLDSLRIQAATFKGWFKR
jgi:hypothetical protein